MSGSLYGPTTPAGGGGLPAWAREAIEASIRTNVDDQYSDVAQKSALVEADRFFIEDSEDTFSKKWTSLFDVYNLPDTTASGIGVIYKDSSRFIHNFEPGGVSGQNIFFGKNAGNFTMTPVVPSDCSFLTAYGNSALTSVVTAKSCTAMGFFALGNNLDGDGFVSIGFNSFQHIIDGGSSMAIGDQAGQQTTGGVNVTQAVRCLFLGNSSRAGNSFAVDEIVIGAAADGNGIGTTTIGSTAQDDIYLFGNLRLEAAHDIFVGVDQGLTGTFNFGGGASGDIASMTFTSGILTGTTLVP